MWQRTVAAPLASGQIFWQLFRADGICREREGRRGREIRRVNLRLLPDGSGYE